VRNSLFCSKIVGIRSYLRYFDAIITIGFHLLFVSIILTKPNFKPVGQGGVISCYEALGHYSNVFL